MKKNLLTLTAGMLLFAGQALAQTQDEKTFSCVADTWIRSDDVNHSGSSNTNLEFRKNGKDGVYANWVALMGFDYSVPAGKKVLSATLHVITERTKSNNEVSLRGFSDNFAENATWATVGTYVEADLKTAPIAKFTLAGYGDKAIFDNGIPEDKQNLAAWTNNIDVTDYVRSLGSSATRVNFMFSQDGEDHTKDIRIYSKENTGCTNSNYPALNFPASDLMPELIVTFVDESAATYIIKNETTGADYSSLEAAWNAAATNDVLLLNRDVTLGTRLDTKERNITIKGNGNVTISRAAGYNNGMLFLTSNGGDELTLEYLTIDGANIKTNAQLIEAGNGGTLYMNDVNIINCVTENALGVIAAKNSGKIKVSNLTVSDCIVPAGMGDIFVGSGGSSVAGDCTFSLFAENDNNVNAEGLTGGKITICEGASFVAGDKTTTYKHAEGAAVATGVNNADLFALEGSKNQLKLDDNGNVTIVVDPSTGIENIAEEDVDAPVEYYTIQGMRVENPTHGLYIVKKGNKVTKIVL